MLLQRKIHVNSMTFILKTHDTIVGKFANLLRKPHVEWYLGKVKIIDSTWRCLLRRPCPCRGLSKSSWLCSLPWAAHLIYRYSCFYLFNFISLKSLRLVEVTMAKTNPIGLFFFGIKPVYYYYFSFLTYLEILDMLAHTSWTHST